MPRLLLASAACIAAMAAFPASPDARSWSAPAGSAPSATAPVFGSGEPLHFRDGQRPLHREHRRDRDTVVFGGWGWTGGEWARHNNRTFAPDSFNDWWHDHPQRSFPRWMQDNGKCQRVWSSGAGWRC